MPDYRQYTSFALDAPDVPCYFRTNSCGIRPLGRFGHTDGETNNVIKFLARYIWVAAAVPFGCASANPVPSATEKDVLPFELRIDGKSAVFNASTVESYLIGRLPAAHIDGAVAVDAPI